MFRIIEDPSSGSLVQRLAKNYSNGSIVSVDMDRVGVMAAYCDPLCVCVVHCVYIYIQYIYTNTVNCIQGIPGGMCQTSGGCSVC